MSNRLEELPGQDAFPMDLSAIISNFYSRAGLVTLNNGRTGSVTFLGTVSPAGGNLKEPVTESTRKPRAVSTPSRRDAPTRSATRPSIRWSPTRNTSNTPRSAPTSTSTSRRSGSIGSMRARPSCSAARVHLSEEVDQPLEELRALLEIGEAERFPADVQHHFVHHLLAFDRAVGVDLVEGVLLQDHEVDQLRLPEPLVVLDRHAVVAQNVDLNLKEPVTESTKKAARCFYALSQGRADSKRYPAIDPAAPAPSATWSRP